MNIIPFLVERLFPSRIISIFLVWIGCIFIASFNYCLLFISPDLPQLPLILAVLVFPILILGFMISMIHRKFIERLVTYGLFFEIYLLVLLRLEMLFN